MHLIDEFVKNEEDAKRALIGTIFADGSILLKVEVLVKLLIQLEI